MVTRDPARPPTRRPARGRRGRAPKFSPPDPSSLAARPRLADLLDATRSVTWVSGPAGAGKTAVLSGWCASSSRPVLWYRVDEQDRDPGAMFAALADCLGTVRRGVERRLPSFTSEQLPALAHFAKRFAREFGAALPAGAVLVFDDCHVPGPEGAFDDILAALLAERRGDIGIVAASRSAPPPALLASLASPGALVIGWDDLRCDDDEARALCRHVTGREPTPEQLRRADGWPAALVLLLRSQGGGVRLGADATEEGARVFEALAAPAFDALPTAQRRTLLATAHASRVTASLAQRCGVPDAGRSLAALWRGHFFVERAGGGDGEPVYRYHPLLRAFLRDRVEADGDDVGASERRLAIARWHEEHGELEEAARMAAGAGATAEAVRLFGAAAPALLARGRIGELLGLAQDLPDGLAERDAVALYWRGLALVHRDPVLGRSLLERAHRIDLEAGRAERALLAAAALLDSFALDWDWHAARPWVDRVAGMSETLGHRFSSPEVEARVLSCGAAAMFPAPDHPFVGRALARARVLAPTLRDAGLRLSLGRFLVGFSWWRGEARATRRLVRELGPLARSASVSPVAALEMLIWCGIVARSDGDRAAAHACFEQAAAIADETGVRVFDFHLDVQRAMLAVNGGDGARAESLFATLNLRVASQGRAARFLLDLTRPGYLMITGNIEAAMQAAIDSLQELDGGGWVFGRAAQQLAMGQIAVLAGRHELAREALGRAIEAGAAMPSAYLDVLGRLALARLDFDTGHDAEGERGLRRALRTAREKGFRHFHPWWIPSMVRTLLDRALQAGIEPAYARFLVRANRLAPPAEAGPRWPYPVHVRTLGGFRIERDGRPFGTGGRMPTRVLDLLKALACRGAGGAPIDRLIEDLWPEADGDAARASFDVCLHRARRLLGEPDALLLLEGRLSFNPDRVWLDLAWLDERTRALEAGDAAGTSAAAGDRIDARAIALDWLRTYRGRVLADQPDAAWVLSARLRWDERLARRAIGLAGRCAAEGAVELAEAVYRRLLDADPSAERAAGGLIALLERAGRSDEAHRARYEFETASGIAAGHDGVRGRPRGVGTSGWADRGSVTDP